MKYALLFDRNYTPIHVYAYSRSCQRFSSNAYGNLYDKAYISLLMCPFTYYKPKKTTSSGLEQQNKTHSVGNISFNFWFCLQGSLNFFFEWEQKNSRFDYISGYLVLPVPMILLTQWVLNTVQPESRGVRANNKCYRQSLFQIGLIIIYVMIIYPDDTFMYATSMVYY